MNSYRSKLTSNLVAPKHRKDFSKEWARRILVDYMCRTDPEWLLASVLRVLDVTAKENPHPGMLSDTYVVEVTYKQGEEDLDTESWLVKVPKTKTTALKDEVEMFMYNKVFPLMQEFADLKSRESIQMPVPLVFHACFDEDDHSKTHLVMENLRDQGYKPLRPEACSIVFMRAAMTCLATVHGTAYAYQGSIGGKASMLSKFPVLTEDNMPRTKLLKPRVDALILPYLFYMGHVQPDLQPQLAMLTKFHPFLLHVYHTLRRDKELNDLKILIHGDSKIDNFMFKKLPDDTYNALMIDWQGACYDLLSNDLMWTLYGFMKNLPDKNSTVDTFLDYSISYYHQELLRIVRELKADPEELKIPTHEYDATTTIKKGFVKDFLQTVIVKPLLVIKDPDLLTDWFQNRSTAAVPKESEVFRSGCNYVNFIHLQMTIATETGVFHDLAPMCIHAMKEVMFGNLNLDAALEDSEDEREREEAAKKKDVDEKRITDEEKDELAKILGNHATSNAALEQNGGNGELPLTSEGQPSGTAECISCAESTDEKVDDHAIVEPPVEPETIEEPPATEGANDVTVDGSEQVGSSDVNTVEEVISGVVYIRSDSAVVEYADAVAPSEQNGLENGDEKNENLSLVGETNGNHTEEVLEAGVLKQVKEITKEDLFCSPPKTEKKKVRKKKSSTESRSRRGKLTEVHDLQKIESKIHGVEWSLTN